jgi:hypothetical protein
MKLKVKADFKWAHEHVNVKEYAKGTEIETDDEDLIRVALDEGWATKVGERARGGQAAQAAGKADAQPDAEAQGGEAGAEAAGGEVAGEAAEADAGAEAAGKTSEG